MWGSFADLPEQLCAHLGDGLLSFLRVDANRRLVTKSPSVARLHQFFAFFPSARLLILVRDGRSVVHSATRSLARDWDFERACREWAKAARTIRDFQQAESERSNRWRIVRYEDLVEDTRRTVTKHIGVPGARCPPLRFRRCTPVTGARVVDVRPSGWQDTLETGGQGRDLCADRTLALMACRPGAAFRVVGRRGAGCTGVSRIPRSFLPRGNSRPQAARLAVAFGSPGAADRVPDARSPGAANARHALAPRDARATRGALSVEGFGPWQRCRISLS